MSAKNKKGGGKGGGGGDSWEESEEKLQAVVLADSFNFRFLPITLEKPRSLLPLVNCPVIDYTIEFLVQAGVQEIFVFCCHLADEVIAHLKKSRWMNACSPCVIHPIVSEGCLSLGDALREIDNRSLVRSDFVLVSGDIASNMKLHEALKAHKERRQKDKNSVMTLLFQQASPNHNTRCPDDDLIVAIDTTTQRIHHCERTKGRSKFAFPLSMFSENARIQLRYDLLDCHVSICSTQVPQLFTDNFDYQTKEDFVHGILIIEEIMGNQIHSHIVTDEYSARVSNLYMYDAVSKDVMRRWVYPFAPDNSLCYSKDAYNFSRHNIYLDKDISISLARDCVLEEDVVIGHGTSVGTGTIISHSVIGRNCTIGDNVVIEGAYLWDDVIIENNCSIANSVLCNGVCVKRNVQIEQGTILSFGVHVGPDMTLPAGVRITLKEAHEEDDFGMDDLQINEEEKVKPMKEERPFNPAEVGTEGRGYIWVPPVESDDEDTELSRIWGEERDSSTDEESSDQSTPDVSPPSTPPPEDASLFFNEVLETIRHGIADKVSPDNMVLEINASKYAYNVTFQELNSSVVKALLETALSDPSLSKQELSKQLTKAVDHVKPMMLNYARGEDAQRDILHTSEDFFVQKSGLSGLFQAFLHVLYNQDILDENVVLQWHSKARACDDLELEMKYKQLKHDVSRFITWLQEAEEESEEEDSDE